MIKYYLNKLLSLYRRLVDNNNRVYGHKTISDMTGNEVVGFVFGKATEMVAWRLPALLVFAIPGLTYLGLLFLICPELINGLIFEIDDEDITQAVIYAY